jgi:hypothetical protein
MMKRTRRFLLLAACLAVFLPVVAALPAARAATDEVEALARKNHLDRSETDDLLRAYRGAVNVGINAGRLEGLIGSALRADMDLKYLTRAIGLITSTALNGLPAGPMLNKFSEGLSKKAGGRDIIEALENRALSLKKARQILSVLIYGDKPLGELEMVIVAVSSALERGVDDQSIEEVFRKEGPDLKKIILEIENLP